MQIFGPTPDCSEFPCGRPENLHFLNKSDHHVILMLTEVLKPRQSSLVTCPCSFGAAELGCKRELSDAEPRALFSTLKSWMSVASMCLSQGPPHGLAINFP